MIWHILRKDLTRLRLPILLVSILVLALGLLDAWRYDAEAGLADTVLNIVLPLAWGILIALAVQLEPLTEDRAFWLTRPYTRPVLLAAKVLFASVAVHLPLLVMQVGVVISHGFWPSATTLLWKQLMVFCAVTLPSLAIASVTSTIAGFGWCAIAAGLSALLLDAALIGRRYPWMYAEWMPGFLAVLVVAAGGLGIVLLQYARRTHLVGRAIGAVAAVAGVLTYSFLPRDFTAGLQCAAESKPPRTVNVRFDPDSKVEARFMAVPPHREVVMLPLVADGVTDGQSLQSEQLSVRLSGRDGRTWTAKRDLKPMPGAVLQFAPDGGVGRQHLMPDTSFVSGVGGTPVRVDGRAAIRPVSKRAEVVLPALFPPTDVPGVGRCSSFLVNVPFAHDALKVICESTESVPLLTRITLLDTQTDRDRRQRLGDSFTGQVLPSITWLSPLQRRQTFYQIVDRVLPGSQDRWLVPREALGRAQVRIEPTVVEGCSVVDYSFEVPDVRAWIVRPER